MIVQIFWWVYLSCLSEKVPPSPSLIKQYEPKVDESDLEITSTLNVTIVPPNSTIKATNQLGEPINLVGGSNILPLGVLNIEVSNLGWTSQQKRIQITSDTLELNVVLEPIINTLIVEDRPNGTHTLTNEQDEVLFEWEGERQFDLQTGKYFITSEWNNVPVKTTEVDLNNNRHLFLCPEHQFNSLNCQRVIYSQRAPKSAIFSPDGTQLWAALLVGPPAVKAFSVETGQLLSSIPLGEKGGVEMLFSDDGNTLWVSQMHTSSVYEINAKTFEVVRQLPSKSSWTKVIVKSLDEQFLYVSNWVGNDVSEIELESGHVTRKWKTNETPRGLYYTKDNKLLVASFEEGTVESIDLETGSITTIFKEARSARHIVMDEFLGRLYISDLSHSNIWVLDMNTMQSSVLAKVDKNPNTIHLSHDNRLLFVSCRGRNNPESYIKKGPEYGTVFVLDAYTGDTLDVIVGGNQPTGLDVSPDGRLLSFTDFLDHNIKIYSIPSTEYLLENGGGEAILDYKKYIRK